MNLIDHDVLVVGGGLAGLRAAIEIKKAGFDVAILSRVHPLRSHSVAAQGGINAALGNVSTGIKDSWENHALDTIKGSDYLADQNAVKILCQEAIEKVIELEHWGALFTRTKDGKIAQSSFGGTEFPRTCFISDRTGHHLLHTLFEQSVRLQIPLYAEMIVLSLIVDQGRCIGLLAFNLFDGKIVPFRAYSVIMATGGYGRIYLKSTNALINTGFGCNLAYQVGAPLKDMEFVQFHPTTLFGTNILISEAARGEGGILINARGERFMERYAPKLLELAPRDIVARAIQIEIDEGRGFEEGYVHLDLRHLGEKKIKERLPGIREIAIHFAGIDPIEHPLPVQPAQHYSMGGISTDLEGETPIVGLFAAGECACVSVHGANRLGGNSLLETIVFGARAGRKACERIGGKKVDQEIFKKYHKSFEDKLKIIFEGDGKESCSKIRDELREMMTSHVGIFREEKKLLLAKKNMEALKCRFRLIRLRSKLLAFNFELIQYFDLESMLNIAEVIIQGALERKESRGAHYRLDYPFRDDQKWLKHTLAYKDDGHIKLEYQEVMITEYPPIERKY
ncbi:MAG: FAD-dependent oxidoreductase [Thermodesulfobacteriota bacterium]